MVKIIIRDRNKNEIIFENKTADVITIGRDESNTLVIKSPSISRLHTKLIKRDGSFYVEDHSSNGTYLNSKKINGIASVKTGDLVIIGDHALKLVSLDDDLPVPERKKTRPARTKATSPSKKEPLIKIETIHSEEDLNKAGVVMDSIQKKRYSEEQSQILIDLTEKIHNRLLEYLDLRQLDFDKTGDADLRRRTTEQLKNIFEEFSTIIPHWIDIHELKKTILNEVLGLGPLEELLADESVTEIMVINKDDIYVEKNGKLTLTEFSFSSNEAVLAVIERIVSPIGRRIDESQPLVDARLKDGSRVNAIIPPLALDGPSLTIRKFSKDPFTVRDLINFGSMTERVATFLECCVKGRKNVFISGGTGSGKTTLLNVLASFIPDDERIVTVEDAAELQLPQPHKVRLETKPPNVEGKGGYSIRDLVKNSLRMRPDRIVIGECRGGEALDMLQAMNTGHDGSLTTGHANSPKDILSRLETMVLMSGVELPIRAIRDQISSAVDIIVQQERLSDGSRRITFVTEVIGMEDDGSIIIEDIFIFKRKGLTSTGKVIGETVATGYLPSFIQSFRERGIHIPEDIFIN